MLNDLRSHFETQANVFILQMYNTKRCISHKHKKKSWKRDWRWRYAKTIEKNSIKKMKNSKEENEKTFFYQKNFLWFEKKNDKNVKTHSLHRGISSDFWYWPLQRVRRTLSRMTWRYWIVCLLSIKTNQVHVFQISLEIPPLWHWLNFSEIKI